MLAGFANFLLLRVCEQLGEVPLPVTSHPRESKKTTCSLSPWRNSQWRKFMKRNALAISLLLAFASLIGCTRQSDQSATADEQHATSRVPVALAQTRGGGGPDGPTNATVQNYIGDCALYANLSAARRKGGGNAEDRKGVARRIMEVADNHFGPGVVFASAAGAENNYLLLAAAPENERSLRFFGAKNVQTIRDRAQLCADGFDQVQLIVRNDDGVNQRLVKRVVLDYDEAKRYMSQTTGARPVE